MLRIFKTILVVFLLLGGMPQLADAQSAASREDKTVQKGSRDKMGNSKNAPVFIKSDTLTVNAEERTFRYLGNVEVMRDDMLITAEAVLGQYNNENQIDTIVCERNVVITRGDDMRASANRADYDVATAVAVLTGAPELYHDGNALNADKVTMFIDEDRSEAEGNVRVKVLKTNGVQPKSLKSAVSGEKDEAPPTTVGGVN